MKIKLQPIENDDDGLNDSYVMWWEEGGDIEVEVPDAIVAEWRELEKRRDEIYAYFEERVRPQIKAEEDRRWAEQRRAKLESMTPSQRAEWERFVEF